MICAYGIQHALVISSRDRGVLHVACFSTSNHLRVSSVQQSQIQSPANDSDEDMARNDPRPSSKRVEH